MASELSGRSVYVAVGRVHGQRQGRVCGRYDFIYLVLPPLGTAVQGVAEVVDGELYGVAADWEPAVVYAVGIAAYGCAEVCLVVLGIVCLNAVESEHYVAQVAVRARCHQRHDAAAEVGHAHLHAVVVGQSIEVDGLAVAGIGKRLGVQTALGQFGLAVSVA